MAELVHLAQNFMNAEDAIIAKKRKRAEQMEADLLRHPEQGPRPKKVRTGEKKDRDNKNASSSTRSQQYLHLNMPLEQAQWKKIPTSAIGTSIADSTKIMHMTQTSVLIWSSR